MAELNEKTNILTFNKEDIEKFIEEFKDKVVGKDIILEKKEQVTKDMSFLDAIQKELEKSIANIDDIHKDHPLRIDGVEFNFEFSSLDDVEKKQDEIKKEKDDLSNMLAQLEEMSSECKYFDKKLCLSNIRELLKQNPDVKIGQIEKEAGLRLGYMSRIEKEDNTASPGIEFLITASKLLKVNLETLLYTDVKKLSPTEAYLEKFLNKLKKDTEDCKLAWRRESETYLNTINTYDATSGHTSHPLYNYQSYEDVDEYGRQHIYHKIYFDSRAFGSRTLAFGDSYNLRLRFDTYIYLMNIWDGEFNFAKEIWMYKEGTGCQFLISNKEGTQLSNLVNQLFDTVKKNEEHPKIMKSFKESMDAFLNGDIADEPILTFTDDEEDDELDF